MASTGTLISGPSASRITGMLVDGIFASEAIDSSGEVFDVPGADISDLEEGRGVANWEHRGDDVPGASGLDIVGKIVFAKKIINKVDCDNDRQIFFWDKIKLPFVYGIVRLYDGAGHEGAKALAAQIRDHVANGEPILVRFSIEGSTLEKEGNRLKRTVARRVALTIKPCNRTCDTGVIVDPNAPEGFKKEPEAKAKDILANIDVTKKFENPMYQKLGAATEVETTTPWIDNDLVKSMVKAKIKEKVLAKVSVDNTIPDHEWADYWKRTKGHQDNIEVGQQVTLSPAHAWAPNGESGNVPGTITRVVNGLDGRVAMVHARNESTGQEHRFLREYGDINGDQWRDYSTKHLPVTATNNEDYERQYLAGHYDPRYVSALGSFRAGGVLPRDQWEKERAPIATDTGPPLLLYHTPFKHGLYKALSAGGGMGAPSTLTGGAALQREDLKSKLVNVAKAAIRDYKPEKHGELKRYLKNCLPEASEHFIDHFAGLVDDYKAKLRKKDDESVDEPAKPEDEKPLTVRGKTVKPNSDMRKGQYDFDEKSGTLKTAQSTLKLWNPDTDTSYGKNADGSTVAGKTFKDIWHSPAVRKQHDYAVRNWIRVHHALKSGKVPEAVLATAVAFSQLSPNTPVPVHEMMYAYLLDTFKHKGMDVRDPRFGHGFDQLYEEAKAKHPSIPSKGHGLTTEAYDAKMREISEGRKKILSQHPIYGDWISRDQPQSFPESSREYFEKEINKLVTNKMDSKGTGRKQGDRSSFMLPVNKFANMAQYHALHNSLADLVARHGPDARSAAAELMDSKSSAGSWEQRRKTAIASGKPDIGDFPGVSVPGLAPKTARFTYAMLGGGNVFVPDTHFSRHLFGLNKDQDKETINLVRDKVLWGEQNSHLASAMDRWYFNNHPAVQYMLNHPEFGEHFRSNPEQAIFPAFWGHWLAISEHEAALGHNRAGVANNQAASHRPVFEEVRRLVDDPVEGKKTIPDARTRVFARADVKKSESIPGGPLMHPIHAAYLMRDWVNQLGPVHASLKFFTHLVPLLMPEHHAETDTLNVPQFIRKMQALTVDLKKALAEKQSEAGTPAETPASKKQPQWQDGPVKFAGKEYARAGTVHLFDQNKMASVLHVDKNHVIAVPNEKLHTFQPADLMKLPRTDEGKAYELTTLPQEDTHIVNADQHGIPYYNTTAEQHALIHGMDTSRIAAPPAHMDRGVTKPVWMLNPAGKMVLVKTGSPINGLSYARREVLYHNAARDTFGLGDYVPTTAIFRSPENSNEYSAQEMVPGADHALPFSTKNSDQAAILDQLHQSGELDKIRVMNTVLGNTDRHNGNFLFTKKAAPGFRLIDHSHAFSDWGLDDWPMYYEMLNANVRRWHGPDTQPMHPAAAEWVKGLKPEALEQQLLAGKLEPWRARLARRTLELLQTRVADPNAKRRDIFAMMPDRSSVEES